jgi:hypothetical protein
MKKQAGLLGAFIVSIGAAGFAPPAGAPASESPVVLGTEEGAASPAPLAPSPVFGQHRTQVIEEKGPVKPSIIQGMGLPHCKGLAVMIDQHSGLITGAGFSQEVLDRLLERAGPLTAEEQAQLQAARLEMAQARALAPYAIALDGVLKNHYSDPEPLKRVTRHCLNMMFNSKMAANDQPPMTLTPAPADALLYNALA